MILNCVSKYVYISSSRKYFHLLEFCVENQNDACVLAHVSIRQKWSLPWRSISPLTFHTSPCSDLLAEGQIHDNNTANQQFFVKRIQLTTHNNAKVIINAPFWEEEIVFHSVVSTLLKRFGASFCEYLIFLTPFPISLKLLIRVGNTN